jgi:hypothetical protein
MINQFEFSLLHFPLLAENHIPKSKDSILQTLCVHVCFLLNNYDLIQLEAKFSLKLLLTVGLAGNSLLLINP